MRICGLCSWQCCSVLHQAMTRKEVAKRNIVVALNQADAAKIMEVKAAEANADAQAAHGDGVARQRKWLIDGIRDSIIHFQEANPGVSADTINDTVLLIQYLHTIKSTEASLEKMVVPFGPGSVEWLYNDLTSKQQSAKAQEARAVKQLEGVPTVQV